MNVLSRAATLVAAVVMCAGQAWAQQKPQPASARTPLVRLLVEKGILTESEAAAVGQASSPAEAERRVLSLLLSKKLINQEEYDKALAPPTELTAPPNGTVQLASADTSSLTLPRNTPLSAAAMPANRPRAADIAPAPPEQQLKSTKAAEAPTVVPAVAPLRVLPITPAKKEGVVPDILLGAGAKLRPYGFFKASVVEQTASSGGPIFGSNDFPQGPLLLGDTGPTADPQFHIKDRAFRTGVDFEWPDPSRNLVITGKLEFDFEGNFTNVNNRNISANRSSQPSLRLAWVRLDHKIGGLPYFVQFGQDWSIFGSSTVWDIFETTGFGFAQGNLYERMPMFRTGVQFGLGDFKIQPEVAIANPSFGEAGLNVDQRTRFGLRVGNESNRPEFQSRLVFQFPLSHAEGVVPAQVIFSYDHADGAEIVGAADLPEGAIRSTFPHGVRLVTHRNAWTAEMQLPTPWVTVVGKYYRGGDLRFYFQGQFNDVFTDTAHRPVVGTAISFAGRTIPFINVNGRILPADLQPVMGQGGFLQLGLPLSRWFHANPTGRNAGWVAYLTAGMDSAFDKDAVRANGLRRTDHLSGQLRYRFNKWCLFGYEQTYIDTRTAGAILKPFRGIPSRTAHAWRSEFGPVFTF